MEFKMQTIPSSDFRIKLKKTSLKQLICVKRPREHVFIYLIICSEDKSK